MWKVLLEVMLKTMRTKKEIFYKIMTIALVAAYSMHTSSCASTKAAPSGGPKDTIPPVVVEMLPAANNVNFPVEDGKIEIEFDEYVVIKDANKNILLSPPLKKQVKTRIKGKSVIVTFPEPLDSNCTYSLNFGEAIADNNENNPYYGLSYSFSTGKEVDSLMLSGTVMDATTLFPIANATVALYLQAKDSTVMTTRPDAVARTDKWGYFTVRNLKDKPYHVFAFTDDNTNNRYDQGNEKVAFLDTTVTPVKVMKKDSPELKYYDPKDTLACLSRPSEIELLIFKENSKVQFIRENKRFSRRGMGIGFNAADAVVDSIGINGIPENMLITQRNITNDSLTIWIKEGIKVPDTLRVAVKYHKTDSTGTLVPTVENLKMVAPAEKKQQRRGAKQTEEKEKGNKPEKRKDLLEVTVLADNKMVEQEGITIQVKEPLATIYKDSITFRMKTPRLIESNVDYTFVQDSLEITKYVVKTKEPYVTGNDYELVIPKGAFKDINGFTNDSITTKISLPTDENLSSLTLEMKNVDSRYIVELINPARSQVFRKYIISDDCDLIFPYLTAGEYSVRITEDKNGNGIIDTGELLVRNQPEKVLLYKLDDGKDIIKIADRTELVQTVDINSMFGKK